MSNLIAPAATNWSKQRLASMLFLVLGTDMFIVSPLLPQLSLELGASVAEVSAVGWSFSVVYAFLSPFCAIVTNRLTRRTAMWIGMLVFSLGALTVALTPTLPLIVLGRVIAGLGASIMSPPVWAFATENAAPHEVGRAVAGVASMFAAGQIIGVPLGSQVAAATSWRLAFLAIGAIGLLLALLIALRLGPERRIPEATPLSASLRASFQVWQNPVVSRLVVANFFTQATRYSTYTFAGALLFSRFGLQTAQLGLVGAAVGLGSLGGSMFGGRLVDRTHARGQSQPFLNVMYAAVMTVSITIAVMSPLLWPALVAWVIGFAAGSAFVGNGQQLVSRATGNSRAYALSWNNTALYAGMAGGTLLLGAVGVGSPLFTLAAASFGLLATTTSLLLWRYTERARLRTEGEGGLA